MRVARTPKYRPDEVGNKPKRASGTRGFATRRRVIAFREERGNAPHICGVHGTSRYEKREGL